MEQETVMKKNLLTTLAVASSLAFACVADAAENNPFGLVYKGAIMENVKGKVNIHPVTYTLNGLKIAANVYTPAGYEATKKYPAVVVAPSQRRRQRTGGRTLCSTDGGKRLYHHRGGRFLPGSQ